MTELNRVYHGDCIEVLKTFSDNSIDLCITSPPYNFGIEYENYNDLMKWEDYYKWCQQWLTEIYRVLKKDGRFVLNHYFSCGTAEHRTSPLFILNDIATGIGYKHNSVLFWNDITVVKRTAWGSWLSASSPYINSPFEGFLILYKDVWKKECKGQDTILKEDFMRLCSGIITDSPVRDSNHPAPFPVKTAKLFVDGLSFENDVVLDPFCGRGSVLIAAKQSNRQYIGIDTSSVYCKLSEANVNTTYRTTSFNNLI